MFYSFFCVIPQRLNLCADVSEHSVVSIFIGRVQRQGTTQKKEYNNFQSVKLTEESLILFLLNTRQIIYV